MSLITLARHAHLRIVRTRLEHAEARRKQTGPDTFGDAFIARLRRQRVLLRGRLLLDVKSIHQKRDLIVCAVICITTPIGIAARWIEVVA